MIDVIVTRKTREAEGIFSFELARVDGAVLSLLFAGGIGVTPILRMAERLAQSAAPFADHAHLHFDDQQLDL